MPVRSPDGVDPVRLRPVLATRGAGRAMIHPAAPAVAVSEQGWRPVLRPPWWRGPPPLCVGHRLAVERVGTPLRVEAARRNNPPARSGGRASAARREGVMDMEIVIVESEADRVDPELVRHIP